MLPPDVAVWIWIAGSIAVATLLALVAGLWALVSLGRAYGRAHLVPAPDPPDPLLVARPRVDAETRARPHVSPVRHLRPRDAGLDARSAAAPRHTPAGSRPE
jgi:hypothetical protein